MKWLTRESQQRGGEERGRGGGAAAGASDAYYTEVSEAALAALLGSDWRQQRMHVLDFSGPSFRLEQLRSADGGLLHAQLHVEQLTTLNLSDNALGSRRRHAAAAAAAGTETASPEETGLHSGDVVSDVVTADNGFSRLRKLLLTRNLLEDIRLRLPSLQVLQLDYNRLRTMPPLDGICNVEVLILSHNQIADWWHGIEECPKLRELDLSYNSMDFSPSQAAARLRFFAFLKQLQAVQLQANPFSVAFPEYAALLVRNLSDGGNKLLRQLDGEPVTAAGRAAAAAQAPSVAARLEEFDDMYYSRHGESRAAFHMPVEDSQKPVAVLQMNHLLEAALQQKPGDAIGDAALFSDLCSQVYTADTKQELRALWEGVENSDRARRALVKQLVENALVLIQRDETIRAFVLRGLAKLCVVKEGNMSIECLKGLSLLLQQSEESRDAGAAEVLAEVVVPVLRSKAEDGHLVLAIINGLSSMKPSMQLAAALSDSIAVLSDMLEAYAAYESVYRVVYITCMLPENCIEATGQGIPQGVTQTLLQTELPTEDAGRQLYCDMCGIVGRCAWNVPKAAMYMGKARLHVEVMLFYMRDLIGERKETRRLTVLQAKLCHALMLSLTGMMHGDADVMRECCDQYHVVDLFLPALKESAANPLILTASATGLRTILENEEQRSKLLRYVSEEIQMLAPLLQYIGGSRYSSLCHQAAYLENNTDTLNFTPDVPPLAELQNSFVLEAMAALAKFAAFFLYHDDDHYCAAMSSALWASHGEQMLLRLLQVRDGEVRYACMQCLAKVSLRYLSRETLHVVIQLLPSLHRPDHSNNSLILRLAVELLTRIISAETTSVCIYFFEHLSTAAVLEILSLLSRNLTLRSSTTRSQVEANREALSIACVNFIRKASRIEAMRPALRARDACQYLAPLLKAEEEQLRFIAADAYEVAVERSWLGRDIKAHSQALSGIDRLDARTKVAFREVLRLTDVLEGKPDLFDAKEEVITLPPLCRAEQKMWDEREMWRNYFYLEDAEREDREMQQMEFIRLALAERLLLFLAPLSNAATAKRFAEQRREKREAEYWAGRLKADIEDMEKAIVQRAERKAAEAAAAGKEKVPSTAAAVGRRRGQQQQPSRLHGRKDKRGDVLQQDITSDKEEEEDPALQHLYQEDIDLLKGRERLMEVLMTTQFHVDPETVAIHLQGGSELYGSEGLWKNLEHAELNVPFITSAFLRCLYACTFGATSAAIRADIVRNLRRPPFLRRLIGLVEACPALSCNVASKFLRLMTLTLQMEPTQSAESMDLIIIYGIMTDWALQILRPLLFILKHASRRPLNTEEQILSAELASLHALLARQTTYIKYSLEYEVQRWAVEKALEHLFPAVSLQTFVAMILFDMQIDAGTTHGSYISHLFTDLAPTRERMRVDCFSILATVMQHCPKSLSYEAMEALQYARVFYRAPLRKSALYDLLDDTNLSNFSGTIELLLSEHSQRAERVLQIAVVRWWSQSKHTKTNVPVRQIVAATNYAFYVFEKPAGIRDPEKPQVEYTHSSGGRIRVDEQKQYKHLTRLVKGFPAAGWFAAGWQVTEAEKTREIFDIFICEKLLMAGPLLDCLRVISGPNEEERVEVLKDVVMKWCLADIVEEKEIQEVLWASVQSRQDERDDEKKEEEGKRKRKETEKLSPPYLALVLLTLTEYYEVQVDWRYWFCLDPMERQEAGAVEEEHEIEAASKAAAAAADLQREAGLSNFVGWMDEENPAWSATDHAVKVLREEAIRSSASEMPSWMINEGAAASSSPMETIHLRRMQFARQHLLSLTAELQLEKIREVEFGGTEESTVTMTFGKRTAKHVPTVVTLTFFDDTARERWRRALANALNRSDASDQWMRFWKS